MASAENRPLSFNSVEGVSPEAVRRYLVLAVPVLPELQAVIHATPSGHMTYLATEWDRSFTANRFGNTRRDWCDEAGLKHRTAHGLRKARAKIAADNGATAHQFTSIDGWETLRQAEAYTRKADRKRLTAEAIHLIVPPKAEQKRG